MSTLAERTQQYLSETGKTVTDLARYAGKSQSAVSQWLNGQTKSLKGETATALEQNTGYRASWWTSGKGAKLTGPVTMAGEAERLADRFGGQKIVALHAEDAVPEGMVLIKESTVRFAAGNGTVVPHYEEIEESLPATYKRDWFIHEGMNPAKVRRFLVHGSSMEPLMYDGDTMLVNLAECEVRDGLVYALRYGDELRVKRCYRKLDGGLVLHSDNPDFRPRDEDISAAQVSEHITIIGRVRETAGTGGL